MIVDANLLLYAVDRASPHHPRAKEWLDDTLNGATRVGLPWPSLLAFVRIASHPRLTTSPAPVARLWNQVSAWLSAPAAFVPHPTDQHAEVLGRLLERHQITGNLIPDAHLAALALEYGVAVCSADSDFARFPEVRWINPLAG